MKKAATLLLALLASCSTPPAPPEGSVMVAPGVTLDLPPPAALGREIEAVQLVTARHGSEVFSFEGHLSVTRDRVLLAGTDGFGQRLMRIEWDGRHLTAEKASFLPAGLHPETVLADVMLIYWPENIIRPRISGASLEGRVEIDRPADPWNGTAHLVNHAWGYEIEARSSQVSP